MDALHGMVIEASTAAVLNALKTNRAKHSRIVEEAREGFMKAAREELEKRLKKLESGEIVSLYFNLRVPEDYTHVYDTAIKMLELHLNSSQVPVITLSSTNVRNLIEDKWDWTDNFLVTNAVYSESAKEEQASR